MWCEAKERRREEDVQHSKGNMNESQNTNVHLYTNIYSPDSYLEKVSLFLRLKLFWLPNLFLHSRKMHSICNYIHLFLVKFCYVKMPVQMNYWKQNSYETAAKRLWKFWNEFLLNFDNILFCNGICDKAAGRLEELKLFFSTEAMETGVLIWLNIAAINCNVLDLILYQRIAEKKIRQLFSHQMCLNGLCCVIYNHWVSLRSQEKTKCQTEWEIERGSVSRALIINGN